MDHLPPQSRQRKTTLLNMLPADVFRLLYQYLSVKDTFRLISSNKALYQKYYSSFATAFKRIKWQYEVKKSGLPQKYVVDVNNYCNCPPRHQICLPQYQLFINQLVEKLSYPMLYDDWVRALTTSYNTFCQQSCFAYFHQFEWGMLKGVKGVKTGDIVVITFAGVNHYFYIARSKQGIMICRISLTDIHETPDTGLFRRFRTDDLSWIKSLYQNLPTFAFMDGRLNP